MLVDLVCEKQSAETKKNKTTIEYLRCTIFFFEKGAVMDLAERAISLFPFNGSGWFGADIIHYTIYTLHFINNIVAYFGKKFERKMAPVRGHAIGAAHGAKGHHTFISALIAHYAHTLDGQENCARLPYFAIKIVVLQTIDKNGIYFLDDAYFFFGD